MLLGYIWLLGTFVNSSCDIKINVNIAKNCCRNLAVRGLRRSLRIQHLAQSIGETIKLLTGDFSEEYTL